MLRTKTVFILGAGASQPFGFPLGFELYQRVVDFRDPSRKYLLDCTAFTERHLVPFIKSLQQSGLTSVDLFLENRPEFLNIGKACMAVILIQKEIENKLWTDDLNWMKYLWQRMQPYDHLNDNQVSFITYNYDRSLEHFLVTSLQNTLNLSIEDSAKIIAKIPIVHLHGRLGYLPWQNDGREAREYHADVNHQSVELSVRHIHVYHEEPDDKRDKEFAEAHRLMAEAQNIYFLGFGFGTKNVERLKFPELTNEFHATGKNLTDKERADIRGACASKGFLHDMDCIDFLRHRATLK